MWWLCLTMAMNRYCNGLVSVDARFGVGLCHQVEKPIKLYGVQK